MKQQKPTPQEKTEKPWDKWPSWKLSSLSAEKVKEITWAINSALGNLWVISKSVSKKQIIIWVSIALSVTIWSIVFLKLNEIKEQLEEVVETYEWKKPEYIIDEWKKIDWIPKNDWKIYIMYTNKEWKKFIATRNFSDYFLDCSIHELKLPDWEKTVIYISRDIMEKEDLSKESVVWWANWWIKIKIINSSLKQKEAKERKYFFNK